MGKELEPYKASRLDFDLISNRDLAVRSEGYPSDAIGTGIAVAIVLIGIGVAWGISKGKAAMSQEN